MITAVADAITTPDVDANAVREAAKELDEPFEDEAEPIAVETEDDIESLEDAGEDDQDEADGDEADVSPQADNAIHGADPEFWEHVGIDPIRIIATSGTFTRCGATTRGRAPVPRPQWPGQRVPVGADPHPLPRRRTRPRPRGPGHLRRHSHRGHRRILRAFVTEENVYVPDRFGR